MRRLTTGLNWNCTRVRVAAQFILGLKHNACTHAHTDSRTCTDIHTFSLLWMRPWTHAHREYTLFILNTLNCIYYITGSLTNVPHTLTACIPMSLCLPMCSFEIQSHLQEIVLQFHTIHTPSKKQIFFSVVFRLIHVFIVLHKLVVFPAFHLWENTNIAPRNAQYSNVGIYVSLCPTTYRILRTTNLIYLLRVRNEKSDAPLRRSFSAFWFPSTHATTCRTGICVKLQVQSYASVYGVFCHHVHNV